MNEREAFGGVVAPKYEQLDQRFFEILRLKTDDDESNTADLKIGKVHISENLRRDIPVPTYPQETFWSYGDYLGGHVLVMHTQNGYYGFFFQPEPADQYGKDFVVFHGPAIKPKRNKIYWPINLMKDESVKQAGPLVESVAVGLVEEIYQKLKSEKELKADRKSHLRVLGRWLAGKAS